MISNSLPSLLAPELILVVGAVVVLLLGVLSARPLGNTLPMLALVTLAAALGAGFVLEIPSSGVGAPGVLITPLTFYVRCITFLVGGLILLVNWDQPESSERGEYFSMILFSIMGVTLASAANDLVVLFFALELVSVPTYVLVALSRQEARASEAAVKYFFLGALAAALMLYGFAFLYGASGSTVLVSSGGNGIDMHFASLETIGGYALIGLLLAFAALLFKIAAVPFHLYAPDVYEGAASPVTGLLGFLPKLAGFVAMIKLLAATSWTIPEALQWMIWIVAAATMTVGNVLALMQTNVKRMLGYSSIAHSGYMLIALLVGPVQGAGPMRDGVAALLFYIVIYGTMNLGAFAVLAALRRRGEDAEELNDLAGLSVRFPWLALAMAVCAFSLMGFPPTAGFLGKVYVFSSAFSLPPEHGFHQPLVVLVVIGVINSAIGAAYYLRIAGSCYLRDPAPDAVERIDRGALQAGILVCSAAMLLLFVWPTTVVNPARVAAHGADVHGPMFVAREVDRVSGERTVLAKQIPSSVAP